MKGVKILLLAVSILVVADFAFAQTWTQTSAPLAAWRCIASSSDGTKLVAVTARGGQPPASGASPGIYLSTDSGTSWTYSTNVPLCACVASSSDGGRLVAALNPSSFPSGSILISTNSGIIWTPTSAQTGTYWNSVASSADGRILVAGDFQGSIHVSTNSGAIWFNSISIGGYVACSADGTKLVAAVDGGLIYTSPDSGITWITNNMPSKNWNSVASSADGNKLIAAVNPGLIYTSTDSGANWTTNSAPSAAWNSVVSSADGNKLAAVGQGCVYTSTNSGTTWVSNSFSLPPSPPSNLIDFHSAASAADGNKLTVGGGRIYTLQTTPAPQMRVAPVNSNIKLSWIVPSTNFALQQSSNLVSWADVTNAPVLNLTNLQNEVTLSPSNSSGFYRIKTP